MNTAQFRWHEVKNFTAVISLVQFIFWLISPMVISLEQCLTKYCQKCNTCNYIFMKNQCYNNNYFFWKVKMQAL